MTNDELKALVESNAQSIAALTSEASAERQQRSTNTDEIDTLLGAVAATEALVNRVTVKVEGNEKLFETLRAEAQADRQETRNLWNDAVTQMETDRTEAKERAEANRTEARAERAEHAKRFDAQQEVIQRLLIELVEMNRDNRRLRDRVDRTDNLEQAS